MSDYKDVPVRVTDASVRECVLYANLHLRGERTDSIGTRLTVKINEEFDRWLAAHDARIAREVAEKAWDEGHTAGYQDAQAYHGQGVTGSGCGPDSWDCDCPNPYRQRVRD